MATEKVTLHSLAGRQGIQKVLRLSFCGPAHCALPKRGHIVSHFRRAQVATRARGRVALGEACFAFALGNHGCGASRSRAFVSRKLKTIFLINTSFNYRLVKATPYDLYRSRVTMSFESIQVLQISHGRSRHVTICCTWRSLRRPRRQGSTARPRGRGRWPPPRRPAKNRFGAELAPSPPAVAHRLLLTLSPQR